MQTPVMSTLRWLRVPGDILFTIGIAASVAFIFGVGRRQSSESVLPLTEPVPAE